MKDTNLEIEIASASSVYSSEVSPVTPHTARLSEKQREQLRDNRSQAARLQSVSSPREFGDASLSSASTLAPPAVRDAVRDARPGAVGTGANRSPETADYAVSNHAETYARKPPQELDSRPDELSDYAGSSRTVNSSHILPVPIVGQRPSDDETSSLNCALRPSRPISIGASPRYSLVAQTYAAEAPETCFSQVYHSCTQQLDDLGLLCGFCSCFGDSERSRTADVIADRYLQRKATRHRTNSRASRATARSAF